MGTGDLKKQKAKEIIQRNKDPAYRKAAEQKIKERRKNQQRTYNYVKAPKYASTGGVNKKEIK